MKTIRIFWLLSFALLPFSAQELAAQTYSEEDTSEEQGSNGAITPQFLASLGMDTTPNPKNLTVTGNSVFVRQIGDFNGAEIRTNTNASEINLTQNGNSNFTGLDYTANTAIADLVQNGDNNRIRDYVSDPTADISLDLVQDGDFLNFERNGVNELTKSLKFTQTEGTPDIIIRSF